MPPSTISAFGAPVLAHPPCSLGLHTCPSLCGCPFPVSQISWHLFWVACLLLQGGGHLSFQQIYIGFYIGLSWHLPHHTLPVCLSLLAVTQSSRGGACAHFTSDTTRRARAQGQTELHKHLGLYEIHKTHQKIGVCLS